LTPVHAVSPREKVPLRTQIGWGFGGLADNFIMNTLGVLVMPIYNIALGMDPVKLGIALCIPRFLDALIDPLIGNLSDNTRTRWGRRRPYIFCGAILSAALLPLLWMPPFKSDNGMFWYFLVLASVYALAYTLFVVPYTALGYELTSDYDERTRVLAWRMYVGLIGSLSVPWLYKLCLLPAFGGDAVRGARWVSAGLALVIIATGILPVIACREPAEAQRQRKVGFWEAMLQTSRNRPFMILLVSYVIIICGLFTSGALGLYINIYYVCGGDKSFAATIGGLAGTLMALTSYVSLPLITWISTHWGKRTAMIAGLAFAVVGIASLWFTMTPKMPYLQLVSSVVIGLGLQGCWLMVSSMVADVCDEDELRTGLRREGVYGAVTGFALKASLAVTALSGGIVLKMSGYDAVSAEKAGWVAMEVIRRLEAMFIGIQCAALLAAIVLFLFYPLTRQRAERTREILDQRRRDRLENPAAEVVAGA
jgi:GPH family glycoside/pentoside/hexuronide:cation symporter